MTCPIDHDGTTPLEHSCCRRVREMEAENKMLRESVRQAVNASCSCGGAELCRCCVACEVWHRFVALAGGADE